MRLSQLLKNITAIPVEIDREVAGITLDSRKVADNWMFIAIKGTHQDGRQYIPKAIEKGATVILTNAESVDNNQVSAKENIPIIPVKELASKVGQLASNFYNAPSEKLHMIGVTGTSGKTSCTHYIAQLMEALQHSCGIIGTLGSGFYGALIETGLTTPDAISLQLQLNDFLNKGAEAVAMEVSSHSIHQGRINAVHFDTAIFTNLSQDHLDYHGDMATYAAVKHQFLADKMTKQVVLNWDDEYAKQWLPALTADKPVYAYSIQGYADCSVPLIYAENIKVTLQGIEAKIISPWGEGFLKLPLIGKFNLSNALAALTALCLYGVPFEQVIQKLDHILPVPGRMQMFGGKNHPLVIVDYAHKPDALEKVLQTLKPYTAGKLICVFGCGGERDQGKRPIMAAIAEKLADKVIITNDNPRHENPQEIVAQIMQGFKHPEDIQIEFDRAKAIEGSIQFANANDCIVIAGKGAENYQQIGDEKFPFDDAAQVCHFLNAKYISEKI